MRLISFLILTLLLSCATDVPTSELTNQRPPCLKRYKRKNKELLYVVVKNEEAADSETRTMILENLKRFDPEIVITMISPDEKKIFEESLRGCELQEKCDLAAWSCTIAKPRGIPCVGGHPYFSEVIREVVRRNRFTTDEALFATVYHSLLDHADSPAPLEKIPELIEANKNFLNVTSRMDKERFLYHYREKMGKGPVILTAKNTRPVANGNYLQRITHAIREAKEALIINRIRKEQRVHERVLVIYSLEHYRFHLAPLEKFFSSELP